MSASGGNLLEQSLILHGPFAEQCDGFGELVAGWREAVVNMRGDNWMNQSVEQSAFLQLPQCLSEHLFGDVWDRTLQLVKMTHAASHAKQNNRGLGIGDALQHLPSWVLRAVKRFCDFQSGLRFS